MRRRGFLQGSAALAATATAGLPSPGDAAQGKRTFRWAFNAAEAGFDPAQISDLYSNYVVSNVFEAAAVRLPCAARRTASAHGGGAAGGVERLPRLHRADPAGDLLPGRSGVQGTEA